jgi:hypothetical protein
MIGFVVGVITGGLIMWYRDRVTASHMIGTGNNEAVASGSDASVTRRGTGTMNPGRPSRSNPPMDV